MLSTRTPLTSMTPAPPNGTTGEAAVPYHKVNTIKYKISIVCSGENHLTNKFG